MKLTKKQAQEISNRYGLGKVKSVELFKGGLVNYNYDLITKKGEYIVRILGKEIDDWKKQMIELEKNVLIYLAKKRFPYEIPIPLTNKKGIYFSKLKGKTYWIYKKLDGESYEKINEDNLKDMAKALSTYHIYMKGFRFNKKDKRIFSLNWFISEYDKIEKKINISKPKNKTDRLFYENFYFFKELIVELSKINFRTNLTICHGDFIRDNILFRNGKVIAFLDFDNLKMAPRVEDVSYTLRLSAVSSEGINKKRMNLFLNEYEKKIKLTKKEKNFIIPLMLRGNAIVFWWMYAAMEKGLDKKYDMLKWNVECTRALEKEWKR